MILYLRDNERPQKRSKMKIKVDGCLLSPSRVLVGTKGSLGEAHIDVSFDKSWNGLEKSVIFRTPTGVCVRESCDGSRIYIPDEVMRTRGKSSFAFLGCGEDIQRTTLSGEVYVLGTLDDGDAI